MANNGYPVSRALNVKLDVSLIAHHETEKKLKKAFPVREKKLTTKKERQANQKRKEKTVMRKNNKREKKSFFFV